MFQELDFNHSRLTKLENLEPLRKIHRLCFTWNLIKKIENLDTLVTLVELELRDNQIVDIENLDALVNLEYVIIFHISKIKCFSHNKWIEIKPHAS